MLQTSSLLPQGMLKRSWLPTTLLTRFGKRSANGICLILWFQLPQERHLPAYFLKADGVMGMDTTLVR